MKAAAALICACLASTSAHAQAQKKYQTWAYCNAGYRTGSGETLTQRYTVTGLFEVTKSKPASNSDDANFSPAFGGSVLSFGTAYNDDGVDGDKLAAYLRKTIFPSVAGDSLSGMTCRGFLARTAAESARQQTLTNLGGNNVVASDWVPGK